ncbi:ATP-binding protein [Clavibacter michiganensis]|uniref:ATP-binding protein n=1 Tax=Clavibacter michiganensis TaxID=28447 RepID=UPI0015E2B80E|nr:ATP-binding protein [Clavibacter michiganensis]
MYNDDSRPASLSLSPYTPGSIPAGLPGRAEKLQQFREAAQRVSADGQFVPRVQVDHGPRGIGKTSLLREAQRIFGGYGVRTVLITADPNEDLVHSLLGELKQVVGSGTRLRRTALESIDSATVTVGAPGIAQVGVTLTAPGRTRTAASAKGLQLALRAALASVVHDGDAGIVILIDEIQEADPESLRTIAYAWQEMNPLRPFDPEQPRTALFAVGLPGAPTKINRAVTFSERFRFQPMHGLSAAGAREALEVTAAAAGVRWDAAAIDRGVAESGGYPYKVQLIGDACWRAAAHRLDREGLAPDDVITLADLREALPAVESEMRTLFTARWRGASPRQQDMLVAIARLGGEDVKRASLADALGTTTRAISVPRQKLLDKGLVDANKHGHLSFTVPGFTEFVIDQAENE